MKCMLDTNILVSAALFPGSISAMAYMKAVTPPPCLPSSTGPPVRPNRVQWPNISLDPVSKR